MVLFCEVGGGRVVDLGGVAGGGPGGAGRTALLGAALESAAREQLSEWFGPDVRGWRHLRTYRPSNPCPVRLDDGEHPSFQPRRQLTARPAEDPTHRA